MAEVPSSSGSGAPIAILAIVAMLAFTVPAVGEVVFQWIPAATSVITGVEVPGDLRNIEEVKVQPKRQVTVSLSPVDDGNFAGHTFLAQAVSAFDSVQNNNRSNNSNTSPLVEEVSGWWNMFVPLSIFVSLLLIVGIIYSFIRLRRQFESAASHVGDHVIVNNDPTRAQLRWQKIVGHANTENPNDWRQAIIEADIMLDELLTVQGYKGDTVGDKMKQVERSDFNTIDLAWEAHKVRNRIAHEGSEHDLNAREVRRIVSLYEQVLHEFRYV
jgi:hypothetical protein